MQEYIAYLIYAVAGKKMSKIVLWAVVVISGSVLVIVAVWHGDIAAGFGYEKFWVAIVRMMFPFFAGLLLYRSGKLIHIPMAFTLCTVLMVVLFMLPLLKYNGLYEALCIIIAFPVIVAAGAGGKIKGRWVGLCRFLGAISYPIYIIHYPFVYIYVGWIMEKKPSPYQMATIGAALFIFFILFAYLTLKLYDEPVRAWIKKKVFQKPSLLVDKS
jgi:peptidoglycan/LPS O-acetylase OafA/YrhL